MATDKASTNSSLGLEHEIEAKPAISIQRLIPLDEIKGLENRVRPISGKHLLELAASIASHGLVSPISVDANKMLLAGAHRVSAFHLLRHAEPVRRHRALLMILGREEVDPEHPPADLKPLLDAASDLDHTAFIKHHPNALMPARVFDFDMRQSEKRALAIEIAENEKRRNFSAHEVEEIIARLEAAGYSTKHGRLKAGEKPLVPELATILKVSRRTVFRLLDDYAKASGMKKPKSNRGRKPIPSWRQPVKHLARLGKAADAADESSTTPQWRAFLKSVKKAVKELNKLASEAVVADHHSAHPNISESGQKKPKSRPNTANKRKSTI